MYLKGELCNRYGAGGGVSGTVAEIQLIRRADLMSDYSKQDYQYSRAPDPREYPPNEHFEQEQYYPAPNQQPPAHYQYPPSPYGYWPENRNLNYYYQYPAGYYAPQGGQYPPANWRPQAPQSPGYSYWPAYPGGYQEQTAYAADPVVAHVVTEQNTAYHAAQPHNSPNSPSQREPQSGSRARSGKPTNTETRIPKLGKQRGRLEKNDGETRSKGAPPLAIISPILALLIIGAGIATIWFRTSFQANSGQSSVSQQPVENQSIPYVHTPERVESERAVKERKRLKPLSRSKIPVRSIPENNPYAPEAAISGSIFFTSTPSGLKIFNRDQYLGTTPFTWSNPQMIGEITVYLETPEGQRIERVVDFIGGDMRRNFDITLDSYKTPEPAPSKRATGAETTPRPPEATQGSPAPQTQQVTETAQNGNAASKGPQADEKPALNQSGPRAEIFIATIPPGADIYIGAHKIGVANANLTAPAGKHTIRFVKDDISLTKKVTFTPGKNPAQVVRLQ